MDLTNICKQTLTKEQQKHYDSIAWLLSEGNRGQGRSRVLAAVIIDEALRTGGNMVIRDHTEFHQGGKDQMSVIRNAANIADILEKHVKIEMSKNGMNTFLRAKGK